MNDEFNDLIKLHKEINDFILAKSMKILANFHSENANKFNLTPDEEESETSHLSSTTVCVFALTQYLKFWKYNDLIEDNRYIFSKLLNNQGANGESLLHTHYNYIIQNLRHFFENTHASEQKEKNLEAPDEFTLLNLLYYLYKIKNEIENEIAEREITINKLISSRTDCTDHSKKKELKSEEDKLVNQNKIVNHDLMEGDKLVHNIIDIVLNFYCNNKNDNNPFRYKDHPHTLIYYRALCVIKGWKKNDFNQYFNEILYEKAKYEMYRQLALYSAKDLTHFDVKRLIYSLLIVTMNNKYSNNLIKEEVIRIIFDEQLKTGLWPVGQVVDTGFVLENGDIEPKKSRIISAVPIISSVECLNDLLFHEYLNNDVKRYLGNLRSTFEWLKKMLREESTNEPLGWYPEFEGPPITKSWVAGHSLIFIKKYCELVSQLIEEMAENSLNAQSVNDFEVTWDKLRGSYGIKNYFRKTINDIKIGSLDPDYRSALIFGPPGSGKSTIAKSLANKLGWDYVEITPGLFLEDGEQHLIQSANEIFKNLVKMKNTVIFFDEVDQLVELRSDSSESSRWVVTALLPRFQELRGCKNIVFILATNNIKKSDPAMRRSGRIDFVIPMGSISWKDRLKMLRDAVLLSKSKALNKEMSSDKSKKGIINFFKYLIKLNDDEIDIMNKTKLLVECKNCVEIKYFLEKTNYILIPDIFDILKIFNKDDWEREKLFQVFFGKGNEYKEYVDKQFKEFHDGLSESLKEYIKIPPREKKKFDINELINDNIFT